MDAFPDCFCKSVVGKMISTGGGPNHPTCVVPRYQSTGRRQSFYFRPIRNNRRSPGWAAAIIVTTFRTSGAPPQHLRRIRSVDANTDFSAGSCNGVTGTERVGTNGLGAVRKSTPRRSESRESDRRGRMSSITSTPSITRPKQVCTPSKCCVFSRFMQIKNCEPPVSLPRWAIESTPRSWYCRPADVSQGMVYPGPPVPSPEGSRPE